MKIYMEVRIIYWHILVQLTSSDAIRSFDGKTFLNSVWNLFRHQNIVYEMQPDVFSFLMLCRKKLLIIVTKRKDDLSEPAKGYLLHILERISAVFTSAQQSTFNRQHQIKFRTIQAPCSRLSPSVIVTNGAKQFPLIGTTGVCNKYKCYLLKSH